MTHSHTHHRHSDTHSHSHTCKGNFSPDLPSTITSPQNPAGYSLPKPSLQPRPALGRGWWAPAALPGRAGPRSAWCPRRCSGSGPRPRGRGGGGGGGGGPALPPNPGAGRRGRGSPGRGRRRGRSQAEAGGRCRGRRERGPVPTPPRGLPGPARAPAGLHGAGGPGRGRCGGGRAGRDGARHCGAPSEGAAPAAEPQASAERQRARAREREAAKPRRLDFPGTRKGRRGDPARALRPRPRPRAGLPSPEPGRGRGTELPAPAPDPGGPRSQAADGRRGLRGAPARLSDSAGEAQLRGAKQLPSPGTTGSVSARPRNRHTVSVTTTHRRTWAQGPKPSGGRLGMTVAQPHGHGLAPTEAQSHPECHTQPPIHSPLGDSSGFPGQLPDFGSWPGFKEPPFSAPAPARVGRCARPPSHRPESPTHSPHSPGIPSVEGEPRYTCRLCWGPHPYPLCPPTSRP